MVSSVENPFSWIFNVEKWHYLRYRHPRNQSYARREKGKQIDDTAAIIMWGDIFRESCPLNSNQHARKDRLVC